MNIHKIPKPENVGECYSSFMFGDVIQNETQGVCLVTELGPINLFDGRLRSKESPFFRVEGRFDYYIQR